MTDRMQPIDPRRRHFFRLVAAMGAMIPMGLTGSRGAQANPVFGDPGIGLPRAPLRPPIRPPRRPIRPPRNAPHCLVAGTKVLTSRGEVAIETVRAGDLVMTESGSFRPVQSVGRSVFHKERDISWHLDVAPVRIAQSAIGPGVPARDLYLSPGHALFVDGYLIPVRYLVNGLTITQDAMRHANEVEYIHLAFERHEVFYAEGTAVESLLISQTVENAKFDGSSTTAPMVSYAPLLGYFGGRQEAVALARLAIYPWVDVRDRIQVVYDQLAARAEQMQADALVTPEAA